MEVDSFSIAAIVLDKKLNTKLKLVTVYGPTHDDRKKLFLTEVSQACSSHNYPMLIGGDFNILRFSSEKNKNFKANKFSDMFNLIINSHELRDIHINGGLYTWSNNQSDPTLEKLDRILINEEWEKIFPLTNIRKIPRYLSDHNPLILSSEQENTTKSKTFLF